MLHAGLGGSVPASCKVQAGQRNLRFASFPKKAQSRRVSESRERDEVNHSCQYFAMATLHPALVSALEHIQSYRDRVRGS